MKEKNALKWPLIIWLFFILLVTFLLFRFNGSPRLNNWVLTYSTISLVFITLFYALQTIKLVEEEQKKRKADNYEKRITDFYMPFIVTLNNIAKYASWATKSHLVELHNELVKLFWGKRYLISNTTAKKIKILLPYILAITANSNDEKMFNSYCDKEKEVRELLRDEWDEIENQIRNLYGIEEKEDEDLTKGGTK